MTREDAQKIADAIGLTVYCTSSGMTTNPVGLEIFWQVEPAREDEKLTTQRQLSHGRFNLRAAADPGK